MGGISGLILVGGTSSRMGEDKALLRCGERTLLELVYGVVVGLTPQVYILTPWPERYRQVLPSSAVLIEEVGGGRGPLVGLSQGLRVIRSEWVFLCACDLPGLNLEVLRGWEKLLGGVSPEVLAVVPFYEGRWEPLCGFYRGGSRESLEVFVERGGDSFQVWLSEIEVFRLEVDEFQSGVLFNCNTREEWLRAREMYVF